MQAQLLRLIGDPEARYREDPVRMLRAVRLAAKLDFSKPFEAHNLVDFTVQAQGNSGSTVTWAMHGPMPYLNRVMTIFFDMDKTVGKDFESGLANLKALAEKP